MAYVEKGSSGYVSRIKRVRELAGLDLRSSKTLVDLLPGLAADELAARYKKAVASGKAVIVDMNFPSTHYQVYSTKWPELDGFYQNLSPALKKLAEEHPTEISIVEFVLKKEVMERLTLAALMAD